MTRTLSIAAVLAATLSCAAAAAANDTPTDGANPFQSHYEDKLYTLAMSSQGTYQPGRPGAVAIALEAKGEYKCNVDYPYKFKARELEGVTFERAVTRKDAMTIDGKRCSMDVGLTPDGAGEKTVSGTFSFSVCTEQRCVVQRLELGLTIAVDAK